MDISTEPQLKYVVCPGAAKSGPNGRANPDAHRMAYWEWNQTGKSHPGHVIICVHGLTRQGRDFDELAKGLSRHAKIVCPDIAGRGRSDWLADAKAYAVPQYSMDCLALMQQLAQEAQAAGGSIERMDWVGTSMGGLIGMGLASLPALPLPLNRLVLNDVGPVIEAKSLDRIGSYLGKMPRFASQQEGADYLWGLSASFGPHTPQQWLELSLPMLRWLEDERAWTLHYDPDVAVPYADMSADAIAAGREVLWKMYDAIQARTLLVRGADSDLLSARSAREMQQRGPKAVLVEFAGVGHAPTLVHADQQQAVASFLLNQP